MVWGLGIGVWGMGFGVTICPSTAQVLLHGGGEAVGVTEEESLGHGVKGLGFRVQS